MDFIFFLDGNQLNSDNTYNRDNFKYLSWSPYDRLNVEEITEFSGFFNSQFKVRWDGVAQQLHLIPENPRDFTLFLKNTTNTERTDCLISSKNENKVFGLNCVITTRFEKNIIDTEQFRSNVYNNLYTVISQNLKSSSSDENPNEDLSWDWGVFNSLGSENMVFIILSNTIKVFDIIIGILNNTVVISNDGKKTNLFSSVSSFLGFNIKDWNENPQADLIIRLNLKSMNYYDDVIKVLESNGVDVNDVKKLLIGRCILDLRIPSSDKLLGYFHDNNIFNGTSDFYKKYISSSRSYWISKNFQSSINVEINYNCFKNSIDYDFDIIKDDTDVKKYPMVQFILQEYKRMIKSINSSSWSDILYAQYKTFCKFIDVYVNSNNVDCLYPLLNRIRTVLQHIRQATTPIAEIPYHNYTYAGSYNDILKMYHGIIAALFKVGNSMPHVSGDGNLQHEITFSVDFESAKAIHSFMYSFTRNSPRFVIFNLPFNSFTDIGINVKYLAHEVFHFIAPYDREKRNFSIIKLWCIDIIRRFLNNIFSYLKEYENDENRYDLKKISDDFKDLENDEELYTKLTNVISSSCNKFSEFILDDFHNFTNISIFLENINDAYFVFINFIKEKYPKTYINIYGILKGLSDLDISSVKINDTINVYMSKYFFKIAYTQIDLSYLKEDIRKIATTYKEAFCDFNMIKLLDMNLEDYIFLLFNCFQQNFGKNFNKDIDFDFIEEQEYRICLVFDLLCISNEKLLKTFEKLINIESNDNTKQLNNFKRYCLLQYTSYLKLNKRYRQLFCELFKESNDFWKEINSTLANENFSNNSMYQIIKNLRNAKDLKELISDNISFMYSFIDYEQIKNTNCHTININNKNDVYSITDTHFIQPHTYAEDLGDYIEKVYRISKQMIKSKGYDKEPCWYRGLCNKNFDSIPSLFRPYKGQWVEKVGMSPYSYQVKMLKDAYFLTLSMPDLWTNQLKNIPEHTSCLQHYGMKTNLLDFSLNMLVALHFALNPDNEDDIENINNYVYTPKVIIFNPVKYSHAIMSLKAGKLINNYQFKQLSPIMFDLNSSYNKDYFVDDMSAEKALEYNKRFLETQYIPDCRIDKYPQPIIIRQSNSRVLSQNGIFLAYNLFADIDSTVIDENKNKFSYLDLASIQEAFWKLCPLETSRLNERFMEEIYIRPEAIPLIKEQLKIMGITRGKMYPDLFNIFSNYIKEQNI